MSVPVPPSPRLRPPDKKLGDLMPLGALVSPFVEWV